MTVGLILGLSAVTIATSGFCIYTLRKVTETWLKALDNQQSRHELRTIELVGRVQTPSPLALAALAPTQQEDSKPTAEIELPTPADLGFVLVDETDHYALRGDDS